MKSKFFFISLFLIFIILLIFELIFYTYFKIEDKQDLENYILKREGANNYFYSNKLNLVLPKPNTTIIDYNKEFTDKAKAKDIFEKGFGLFDDGNKNNRKYQMIALGDSFTYGAGSFDPVNKNIYSLIEKIDNRFNIVNFSRLGKSIHDQKYAYDKLKNFTEHDYLIYNFFSGGDYKDNLSDFSSSYYVERTTKNFSEIEQKNFINELNKLHGFKYHLEYLMNNKIKSYNIYFILKIYDFFLLTLNLQDINFFNLYEKKLFKKYPRELGRLEKVDLQTYELKDTFRTIILCEENYCFEHDKIFEIEKNKKKIIDNSAKLINNFYLETLSNNKKFVFVIHPSARNLFSKEITKVDYNEIDEQLMKKLNKNIIVIDLRKYLVNYQKQNPDDLIFWKHDGHYTPEGYEISHKFIYKSLLNIL